MLRAVLTGIDTHPANSIALILRSVGYEVFMLSDVGLSKLRSKGYTGGVEQALLRSMGYHEPNVEFTDNPEGDIFVDLKLKDAQSYKSIFPEAKVILYPINGGYDDYEDYAEYFPTITNNFWIKNAFHVYSPLDNVNNLKPKSEVGKEPPIDLLHNAYNWGMKSYIDDIRNNTGLRIFGSYGSPDGMIKNTQVGEYMTNANSFVHIKASDCPGWALWEAFATATPVVVMSLFVKRMHFEDLYIDGETCLTWGDNIFEQDEKDPRIIKEFVDEQMPIALKELYQKVAKLKDPVYNRKIGMQGYEAWKKATEWTEEKRLKLCDYLIANDIPCVK